LITSLNHHRHFASEIHSATMSEPFMDSSRHLRVKTVLHARVWGLDANSLPFMQVATIRDISDTGIVVNGLVCPLKKGAVVDIQYNGSRAEFLVQWVDKRGDGTAAGLVGLQRIASERASGTPFLSAPAGRRPTGKFLSVGIPAPI
jgi:hypothetical protein